MPTFRPCPPVAPGIALTLALIGLRGPRVSNVPTHGTVAKEGSAAASQKALKVGTILPLSYLCLYLDIGCFV